MRALIRATSLLGLLALSGPVVAQQDATQKLHSVKAVRAPVPEASGQGGYMGYCGQWFRCYTGIPLRCGENTRPYQDISSHTCLCVHNGCPQQ